VTDYNTYLPWLYLAVNAVVGLVLSVIGTLAAGRLALIYHTVNSNLAVQVNKVVEKERENADLRVQNQHLQTQVTALTVALTPKADVVAVAAQKEAV
jgi:hypothetical protein